MKYVNEKKKFENLIEFTFNIKDLRTTFATMLEEKGISMSVYHKWLGHTTDKTTKNYYVKVLPDFEREEAEKFDK